MKSENSVLFRKHTAIFNKKPLENPKTGENSKYQNKPLQLYYVRNNPSKFIIGRNLDFLQNDDSLSNIF